MSKIRMETAGQPIEFEIGVARSAEEDRSTEDGIQATLSLANEGGRALKPLIKALKDESKLSIQLAALKVLESLYEQNTDVSSAYQALADCVEHGQPMLANAAEETFSRLGPDAVRWTMQRIEKNPAEVPDWLCEIIARHADEPDVIGFMRVGVHSKDDNRRIKTGSIIDSIFMTRPELASQEMVEIMYHLQKDPVDWVRRGASMGLARAPETVDVDFARVIQNLCWDDDPFMAFGNVFQMIGAQRQRARPAIPTLLDVRRNPPPGPYPSPIEIRVNVTNALCMIDPARMRNYLRELVDIENGVTCGMILITLDEDVAIELLREWMEDKRPTVVETAIKTAALNGFIGAELAPQIGEFLKSEKKSLQLESAKSLRDIVELLIHFSTHADKEEKNFYQDRCNQAVIQMKDQLTNLRNASLPMKASARKVIEGAIKNIEALIEY